MSQRIPSQSELDAELGGASPIWEGLMREVAARYAPLFQEWMASKARFGSMCRLKKGKRTLLYMTPQSRSVLAALVLGDRAVAMALESGIPEHIKALIREARPYAEGRGIRFPVNSPDQIQTVLDLLDIKLTPK